MKAALEQARRELNPILGDMASAPPSEKPARSNPVIARLIYPPLHLGLVALNKAGQRVNRSYERPAPDWPFRAKSIIVLGWGGEKIAYKVSTEDEQAGDIVVSVYHLASMGQDPLEVIRKKKAKYEMYRQYFGELVVSTAFSVVDNPWGEGGKPATTQRFLERTEQFRDYDADQLAVRAAEDLKFANNLERLKVGYGNMLADGHCPDFGRRNLVISGSDVWIFDTGLLWSANMLPVVSSLHPNYKTIESIYTSALAN